MSGGAGLDVRETELAGVLLVQPTIHRDHRGHFLETWRADRYAGAGLPAEFAQDNTAVSRRGVVRGLHYQHPEGQGKLVTVLHGEVFDVAVDIRRGSPTHGRWVAEILSAENGRQLWVPEGFAHGYAVLSEVAVVIYKCTRTWRPENEGTIRFDDPALGIAWPVADPVVSPKDAAAPLLADLPPGRLPGYAPPAPPVEAPIR